MVGKTLRSLGSGGGGAVTGVWGCLTHTSLTDRPEARAAALALEGAESVDAETFGTGAGISALVYICSGGWDMKIII